MKFDLTATNSQVFLCHRIRFQYLSLLQWKHLLVVLYKGVVGTGGLNDKHRATAYIGVCLFKVSPKNALYFGVVTSQYAR